MGCILAIIAMLAPRVLMAFIWLLTNWFGRAYDTVIWPLLGFLFMPYTTLAYMGAMIANNHALRGGWLILFIIAVIIDAGNWGGSYRARK
ncbi:MAG: hypothetical protein K9N51_08425 [Candidatus Pacebacteria bacterium]|nr:hypothetical protein [Candidatus Paceibacterota bacterium]